MCPSASSAAAAQAPTAQTQPPGPPLDCIPSDPISQAAYEYASSNLHPWILNHSIRVYLFAKALARRKSSPWIQSDRIQLLFVACILHDIGTTSTHDGPQRFEVEGADAAKAFLLARGVVEEDAHAVWIAIACHTSPGIAEKISKLALLVRLGVTIDFKRAAVMAFTTEEEVAEVEGEFERGEIEKVLGDAVVEQGLKRDGRERAEKVPPASWPGVLVRSARENPGWEGVNKAF